MKIGFDAKRATANFTGLGNYSRTLIRNVEKFYPEQECILFTPVLKRTDQYTDLLDHPSTRLILPSSWFPGLLRAFWRTFTVSRLAAKHKAQIFHGLSGELPFFLNRQIKAVLTVHDLIFMRFPAYYKPFDRFLYRMKLQAACKRADRILAISEQTKQDLVEFMGLAPERIKVMYQTCDPAFQQQVSEEKRAEVRKKYNLPDSFLLSIGTLEERKNTLLILKAMPLLPVEVKLVLAGRKTGYATLLDKFVHEHQLENRVLFLDRVSFEDLPALYQLSEIFIYPSVFEGFGIPILEALFSGVPVISSQGSCFTEAGGPDSIYVEHNDYEGLGRAILNLLGDHQKREKMSRNGRIFAENFLPAKLSAELMNVYQEG